MRSDRLTLGNAAILTVNTASQQLPVRNSEARKWLRSRGLVRNLDGREVVVWGEVVALILEMPKPEIR